MIVRDRGYLPHLEHRGATFFVTFRLAGSLPATVLERFKQEREAIRNRENQGGKFSEDQARASYLYSEAVEKYLDSGKGECWLSDAKVADLVVAALRYFDGQRYILHAWSVMPNHVHVLFSPRNVPGTSKLTSYLIPILHSWKSYSANQANAVLGRRGQFWQEEYYDVLVRSERQFAFYVGYILRNPVHAGLCKSWRDWPWSGCSTQISSLLEQADPTTP